MKRRQIFTLLCGVVLGLVMLPRPVAAASASVVISEVQLQSSQSATEEFVELYNAAVTPVDIKEWKVEYVTAAGTLPGSALATFEGRIAGHGFVLLAKTGYLAQADTHFDKGLSESGGHIRLVNAGGQEIDRVGWGTAALPEGKAAASPAKGSTLRREADVAALFKDTDSNIADFVAATPDPQGGGLLPPNEEPPAPLCTSIGISEVLPNPQGADADGGEFVEFYNSADSPVSLEGCTLATDKMTATALSAVNLAAHEYYVVELKDKLLNGGGTVTLGASATEETVVYPALAENEAWALFGAEWKRTLQPTPAASNVFTPGDNEGPAGPNAEAPTPSACAEGKYRNPTTNRCKNIETPEAVTACKPGQTRNPETNRCRSVLAASTTTSAACAAGQERNPATNRCRKVTAAAVNAARPCPAGQERNSDTNRCRKIAATTGRQHANSSGGEQTGDKINVGILAIAGTAALGYGAFEYRTEVRAWFGKLKSKLPFLAASE